MDDLPERIWATLDVGQGGNFLGTCWLQGGERETEYLRADHVATLLAEERRKALTVKPLAWSHKPDEPQGYTWSARKPFGSRYYLHERNGLHSWGGDYVSLEAAKAAAQADYERRILSALSDAPAREVTVREASPCGGCGESDPRKRCIGCLHDFGALSQGGEG